MNDSDYSSLPEDLQETFRKYIENHIQPGGFVRSVLENNLVETCARADNTNRYRIFDIVGWVYNEAPNNCWGSPEKVRAWLKNAGS